MSLLSPVSPASSSGADGGEHQWLALAGFVVGTQLTGAAGVPFTLRSIDSWYAQLRKPPFNPPQWVFGPAWTFLYLLMAIAAWRVWRHRDHPGRGQALALWAAQLALNALWTPLFFGARRPRLALAELAVLWGAIVATRQRFAQIDRPAAKLLVPYLTWVTFAGLLNAEIVRRNPLR